MITLSGNDRPYVNYLHEVTFAETDMARIAHFSNFYKWMEQAELAFFDKYHIDYLSTNPAASFGWPKGSASCTFKQPARFRDNVNIHLALSKIRSASFSFDVTFSNLSTQAILAEGSLVTVYATFEGETEMKAQTIPDSLIDKLELNQPL